MGILVEQAKTKPEPVPKDWKTSSGWSKAENISESHTYHLLARMVRDGKWEKTSFLVLRGGRVYPVPHYRPKK